MMRVFYRFESGRWQKTSALALLSVFALLGVANAGGKRGGGDAASNPKIDNFGQMDGRFFRGAQPRENDYPGLAQLGIKTIIDLTDKPTSYEKHNAEAAGLHYISIPMSDSRRPAVEQIDQFLKIVNNPETGKFYVHCIGGRHRTGVMGAVYRMNLYGWSFDQAYSEMKQYDFYTRFGHGDLKDFVKEYAESFHRNTPATLVETSTEASTASQPKTH
jgi:protein tyrosine/serine phosphatase